MYKNLSKYLLISAALNINGVNAASSADDFFQRVNKTNISQLFNDSAQNVKDEIYHRVTDTKATKDSLGVNVMMFTPLKDNDTILKYSPSHSASSATAVGRLSDKQRSVNYGNTTGAQQANTE